MKRIIVLFIMVFMLTACGGEPTPQPTATTEPTPMPTISPTPKPERKWLTFDEVNRANLALRFERKEYPEIRAFLMYHDEFASAKEYNPLSLARGLASTVYNGKYLDKENPYLTSRDKYEIEWLKQSGTITALNIVEDVENGEKYARVPLSTVNELLEKYMDVTYKDITGQESFDSYNQTPVFYVKEGYRYFAFDCNNGYVEGDMVCLYTVSRNEYSSGMKLVLKKTDNGYKIVSHQEGKYVYENLYRKNGETIYDYTLKKRTVYLYQRPEESAAFNKALQVYNDYLVDIGNTQQIYGYNSVRNYALRELTHDDVPELILIHNVEAGYGDMSVLSYTNGEIIKLELPYFNTMDGFYYILADDTIGSYWCTTGGQFIFYTYKPDGSYDEQVLNIPAFGTPYTDYDGNIITEEEYQKLYDECRARYENRAKIDYRSMYSSVVYD